MAHQGAADSYYNNGSAQPPLQPQMQYPPQGYNSNGYQEGPDSRYQQPPPTYGQNYQNAGPPLTDGKQTFDQAFKLDRPKWNDLWAGILVCRNPYLSLCTNCSADLIAHSHIPWFRCRLRPLITRICRE